MQPDFTFDWKSVHVPVSDVTGLMRRYRSEHLEILFHYAEVLYRVGVNPDNTREPFYLDEDTYPSMFAFCSSAYIEGGFLLPDLQEPLDVIAVNGADPAPYFS